MPWLLKTEPEKYSIADLAAEGDQVTFWNGVRNYQARNFLRDAMKLGDHVLLYHSNADPPAIVGTAKVVREGYPDHTAWDPNSDYYDPQSSRENPRWFMVDIQLVEIFTHPVSLNQLRDLPELAQMELLRKGSRLSVQPVRDEEYATILRKFSQKRKK